MGTISRLIAVASVCLFSASTICSAAADMTYADYESQLSSVQQREKTAKEEIATEQGKIESLKQQISEVDQKIADVIREKYTLAGCTEQDVIAAETEIASIRQALDALLGLAPEDLAKRQGDIKAIESRIAALKAKPASYFWKVSEQINGLDQLVDQVKSRAQMAGAGTAPIAPASDRASSYTVKLVRENRECLYLISGYDFVYGDPAKWPYLYRANQSIIDRGYQRYKSRRGEASRYSRAADLIFPGQVLDIPR
jgi:hypothetical protein